MSYRQTLRREGGHFLLRHCALWGVSPHLPVSPFFFSHCLEPNLQSCHYPARIYAKLSVRLCGAFASLLFISCVFVALDHRAGVRRSRVSAPHTGLRAQRGQVYREVSTWRLSSCVLPISRGLLRSRSWQPVCVLHQTANDVGASIRSQLWYLNENLCIFVNTLILPVLVLFCLQL